MAQVKYYKMSFAGGGITPAGKLNITDTAEKDVTNYASAQVVDANLIAANIKEGVTVLGITGTHQGGTREGVVVLDDELGIYSGVTVSQSNNALIIGG